MKVKSLLVAGFFATAQGAQIVKGGHEAQTQDGTISKVVKMLEDMLSKSKEDGEKEKELFDKFKCYCDDNKEEKEKTIEDLTKESGLLESQIEGLQGSTGGLSADCAKLKKDMETNEQARATAEEMRKSEHEAFVKEEADLTSSIAAMGEAITTLAEVGADQTLGSDTQHEKFMAGFEGGSLLKVKDHVKQALLAAESFLVPAQKSKVDSFLQKRAPFTGTYSSQSGEVVGILKNMKDTFESNLETAKATEKNAQKTHDKFMETKTEEYDTMKGEYDTKQETLSGNDGDLATTQEQYQTAKDGIADAQEFLSLLEPQCVDKTKDFEKRVELRVNEEAAISKAIAILSSDLAAKNFGKVEATAGAFIQLRATHRHVQVAAKQAPSMRLKIQQMLLKSAKSGRVRRVAVLLQAGNPFDKVLTEIDKMIELIDKEAKNDKKQKDWCTSERETNDANLEEKKEKITTIEGRIDELVDSIDNPETGLKQQITETEESLQENSKSQSDETATRREEHATYTTTVSDIVRAESLLQKAVAVLKEYYSKLAKEAESEDDDSLLQKGKKKKEEPNAPETWEGDFEGQSGQGNEAISMIEFIIEETKKEEDTAHESEASAQKGYEESMTGLKEEEASLQEQLVNTKKELSEAELELEGKREELDVTTKEKVAIERYLEKISPGCDFITDNFDTRESNRGKEKEALENAVSMLKESPSFKAATIEAEQAAMGECKDRCNEHGKEHAECAACLAKVSVPGYCAGHPGTPGC